MSLPSNSSAFGKGSPSLAEGPRVPHSRGLMLQYQIIGRELVRFEVYERSTGLASLCSYSGFREGVAFVNVEVLEAYLDDLLSPQASDDTLFIRREVSRWNHFYFPIFGLLLAMGAGAAAAKLALSAVSAICVSVLVALPFACVLYCAPRTGLRRRMVFAQMVSDEVLRRRGRGRDNDGFGSARQSEIERIMDRRLGRMPLHGAARVTVH